ncbi:hypothetical protein KW834_01805 [Pseudomonas sp. PDM29]|uniref:hypothetical protein n=1 Tax=Pseudomonas sp. PDM29 TaxID=2854771 RepID=UPI001C44DD37|nr:hypothetical protein [Pseudomonas sp. PDM29]MBV7523148.1 hypothetical protein [Pseudomonas sp. PDM29]
MAARKHPMKQWEKDRRKAQPILKKLMAFIFGEIHMTNSQVTAALAALDKVMPDLKPVEYQRNPDTPLVHGVMRGIVDPKAVAEAQTTRASASDPEPTIH